VNTKDGDVFVSGASLRERAAALARYEAWDRAHRESLDPAGAIAAVASLYRLLPEPSRTRDDDPEFQGVRRMLDALALLGRSRG